MQTTFVKAFGTTAPDRPLEPMQIKRRALLPHDVELEIRYCGICHSDLHAARGEWSGERFPMVPGHEIAGIVTRVGEQVHRFQPGDRVAVGCLVDSCRTCEYCREGEEQFCDEQVIVFGSPDKHLGGHTFGGFAETITVDENYVLRVPDKLDLPAAAPILCAGITVYSPLKRWKAGPGKKVGVVGIGGLGHMAIKIAKAMGAQVVAFSTSPDKEADARRLGADEFVVSSDRKAMKRQSGLDLILDTVSGKHDVNTYLRMLRVDGSLVLVGLPAEKIEVGAFHLVGGRKHFSGSNIGGIRETQEVLDFCAEHGIAADIELIAPAQINEAFDRLQKGDVKYRFVVDMSPLNK